MDPTIITNLLGIHPLQEFRKGDRYGKQKLKIRKNSFWYFSTDGQIKSDNIEDHLLLLLEHLERVRRDLIETIEREKFKVEITCVFHLFTIENGFSIGPEILERIAQLKLRLGISIYYLGGDFLSGGEKPNEE